MDADDETRVIYNAECPICRFEIGHYASRAASTAPQLRFDDLNATDLTCWGITADQAARRLHVVQGDRVVAGIDAFLVIWATLPGYRWLARLVGLPGLRQVSALVYDRALAPALYAMHRRRLRRRSAG